MQIAQEEYDKIAELIHSENSPVGIDAKKTHILILHKLQQIQDRLDKIEAQVSATSGQQSSGPGSSVS